MNIDWRHFKHLMINIEFQKYDILGNSRYAMNRTLYIMHCIHQDYKFNYYEEDVSMCYFLVTPFISWNQLDLIYMQGRKNIIEFHVVRLWILIRLKGFQFWMLNQIDRRETSNGLPSLFKQVVFFILSQCADCDH